MTTYRLPKKIFILLLLGAGLPFVIGLLHFMLLLKLPGKAFGAAIVFILLGGVVFFGAGIWALYHALWRIALRVEIGKDTVSFYAAFRTVPISLVEITNVETVPWGSTPIGAVVAHTGGREYLLATTSRFKELVHKLTPVSKTGFVRS